MKLVRWVVCFLSGDDGFPLNCREWQMERRQAQWIRRAALRGHTCRGQEWS